MYQILIFIHSAMRWLVLLSLLTAIYTAYQGVAQQKAFSAKDNAIRHWTATIVHIQLLIGMLFYIKSPVVRYFWQNISTAMHYKDIAFFGIIHIVLMLIAIITITIGSAKTKRKRADRDKFRTMLVWYAIALLIIIIAIPWPFSPLAARPYLR